MTITCRRYPGDVIVTLHSKQSLSYMPLIIVTSSMVLQRSCAFPRYLVCLSRKMQCRLLTPLLVNQCQIDFDAETASFGPIPRLGHNHCQSMTATPGKSTWISSAQSRFGITPQVLPALRHLQNFRYVCGPIRAADTAADRARRYRSSLRRISRTT